MRRRRRFTGRKREGLSVDEYDSPTVVRDLGSLTYPANMFDSEKLQVIRGGRLRPPKRFRSIVALEDIAEAHGEWTVEWWEISPESEATFMKECLFLRR